MIHCAVIGATGYTGVELIKILLRHSQVRLTQLTTRQEKAIPIQTLIPTLPNDIDLEVKPFSLTDVKREADLVFVCLPHTEAMVTVKNFRKAGKVVIDLSADFRLKNTSDYAAWYGEKHQCGDLLQQAVYGLPELYREQIKSADLIANPGCYPTGISLGIIPLLKAKLVERDSIVIDSKSGVSGAGKKPNPATQFAELDENFYAYKVNKHQHTPEILQTLRDVAKADVSITFVPHLLPVVRGILSVIYLRKRKGVSPEKIRKAFESFYHTEPFVRLKPEGQFPTLKDVQHTNFCDIGLTVNEKANQIIVITAIDNLIKGASGQAVQNMNIRYGFPEAEGLRVW